MSQLNIAPHLRSNITYPTPSNKEMSMLRQDFAGINKRPDPVARFGGRQERDRLQGETRFPNKGKGLSGYPLPNASQVSQQPSAPPTAQHPVQSSSFGGKLSNAQTAANAKPQIPGFKTTQLNLQNLPGNQASSTSKSEDSTSELEQSSALALSTVMEELKRIQDKMDNTPALVMRLDKMSVLHNRQTEMINKTQDALTSLSADVQALHQVNGGSFAGKLEAMDARVSDFEKSIGDMSREVIANAAESKRLQESYHEQQTSCMVANFELANKRIAEAADLTEAMRSAVSTLENKCSALEAQVQNGPLPSNLSQPTHDELDALSREMQNKVHEAQEMSVRAFHQSIATPITLDQECKIWYRNFNEFYHAPAGTAFTVRFPMVHHEDGVYMKHMRVSPHGTVYEENVPIEIAGSKVASFA